MVRDYELGIIINPEVGDEQARAIVERVTQFVGNNGGQVVRVNAWGRRHLTYPIEHHRDGLYFFFDLVLPPQLVAELERTLRVNEDVMRHLILVRDPRVVAQQRQRDAELEAQAARAAAQAPAPEEVPETALAGEAPAEPESAEAVSRSEEPEVVGSGADAEA
jgi:small subunit ribosomal protein S6